MQKNWKVVLLATFGLALGLYTPNCYGEILWQSISVTTPSIFKGYDKVFVAVLSEENLISKQLLEETSSSRVNFTFVSDPQKQFEAMQLSKMSIYVSQFSIGKGIQFLRLTAKAAAKSDQNGVDFLSTLWQKDFVLEDSNSLQKAIKAGLEDFFSAYFKDNVSASDKPTFFVFQH